MVLPCSAIIVFSRVYDPHQRPNTHSLWMVSHPKKLQLFLHINKDPALGSIVRFEDMQATVLTATEQGLVIRHHVVG